MIIIVSLIFGFIASAPALVYRKLSKHNLTLFQKILFSIIGLVIYTGLFHFLLPIKSATGIGYYTPSWGYLVFFTFLYDKEDKKGQEKSNLENVRNIQHEHKICAICNQKNETVKNYHVSGATYLPDGSIGKMFDGGVYLCSSCAKECPRCEGIIITPQIEQILDEFKKDWNADEVDIFGSCECKNSKIKSIEKDKQ